MLRVLKEEGDLLTYLGKEKLDESMIADAEQFPVRIMASTNMNQ